MRFELLLALRFLREGRTQSALIVGGVMVGVAVVVFISALVTGLQANTINRTLGAQAHIVAKPIEPVARVQVTESAGTSNIATLQVAPRKVRSIDNWQQIIAAFEDVPGVVAVSPMASGAAIALRGEGRNAVTVFGIDLPRYDRIVDLSNKLVTGKLRLDFNENTVGCSPQVIEALKQQLDAGKLAVYPEYLAAKEAIASYFGVMPEQFLFTNGTDEAIQVFINTYVDDGQEVLVLKPREVPVGVWPVQVSAAQLTGAVASFVAEVYVAAGTAYESSRTQSALSVPVGELLDNQTYIGAAIATGSLATWLPSTKYVTLVGPHAMRTV